MQQFPEDDETQESPRYPGCLFVNIKAKIPLSLKRFDVLIVGGVMSIGAPRGRKHLSADALVDLVRSGFATILDDRRSETDIS